MRTLVRDQKTAGKHAPDVRRQRRFCQPTLLTLAYRTRQGLRIHPLPMLGTSMGCSKRSMSKPRQF